jgi:hypothetical protein
MDITLAIVVDRVRAKGFGVSVEDELLLIHRRMWHYSFSLLKRLYPLKYEKIDKHKLVFDGCEFGKHTRSSYVSSVSKSSHAFDLIYSDVWRPCSTTEIVGHIFFVTFIDSYMVVLDKKIRAMYLSASSIFIRQLRLNMM